MSWRCWVVALSLLLGSMQAPAQSLAAPSCWAITPGTAGYATGTTPDGRYAAWWCPEKWDWSASLLVMKAGYALIHPPTGAASSAMETAAAYWKANVNVDCLGPASSDAAMVRLCASAAQAALDGRPLSRWIVNPYPGATYRAVYTTTQAIGGIRKTPSTDKVLIRTNGYPTPCNCTLGRVVDGSVTYCSVLGKATSVANCNLR